jgi:hypothetical protein
MYGDRKRAASFSKQELNSLKENLINSVRSQSFKFVKQQTTAQSTGECSLSISRQARPDLRLDTNLANTFAVLFEAGYLFKYKDIVWAPQCEDDEDEEQDDDSSEDSVAVVRVRKSKKSRRAASEEELSGNFEKNKQRKSSFKLSGEHHDHERSPYGSGRASEGRATCCT